MSDPRDRPVWTALATGWASLAVGDGRAKRLHPDYGPFAAAADGSAESLSALAGLCPPDGVLALIERAPPAFVPGLTERRREAIVQMAWGGGLPPEDGWADLEALTDDDAPEMLALARLTQPGPFERGTHRLSPFLGVRIDGRLAAMAGERMRLPGHAELSGVCTHPDFRGRGLAGALSRAVTARILRRGETPMLHSWAANARAIALYDALGYRVARDLTAVFLAR